MSACDVIPKECQGGEGIGMCPLIVLGECLWCHLSPRSIREVSACDVTPRSIREVSVCDIIPKEYQGGGWIGTCPLVVGRF